MEIRPKMFKIKDFFKDYKYIYYLYGIIVVACILQDVVRSDFNNYLIFRGVFWHTLDQLSLYASYPNEYGDHNHYGILFGIIVAPFAMLPNQLGCALWVLFNTVVLVWAVKHLPLSKTAIITILLISAHDMYTAVMMQQFNPSIIALLVLSFVFIEKKKDHWATLCIVIGLLTKLYGIVGLAFFFFSKDKIKFIYSGLFWLVILYGLPMLYSSFDFVNSQYVEWFETLSRKNQVNLRVERNLQNLSLLGFLQRTGIYANNLVTIIIGLALFCLPYLRIKQYQYRSFRIQFLALCSLFLVLFSTGTENSGYIIGYVGVGIWFVTTPKALIKLKIPLLILAIVASLSPTDLFPKHIKWDYIVRYSLRAVPIALIYISLIIQMCTLDYKNINLDYETH